eukprot:scaffold105243_cov17-Tisochrysis_lutea.AAC.2
MLVSFCILCLAMRAPVTAPFIIAVFVWRGGHQLPGGLGARGSCSAGCGLCVLERGRGPEEAAALGVVCVSFRCVPDVLWAKQVRMQVHVVRAVVGRYELQKKRFLRASRSRFGCRLAAWRQ